MDNWHRGGRGRGNRGNQRGGRGRGHYHDNRFAQDDFYDNDNYNTRGADLPITARLGPKHNAPPSDAMFNNSSPRGRDGGNGLQIRGISGGRGQWSNDNAPNANRGGGGGRGRNQTFGSRGRGRGGRSNWTRNFADEDIDMQTDTIAPGQAAIAVSGYPPGSEEKVLGFMNRKAKVTWEPLHVQNEQGKMIITVADQNVADNLCRMNGYNFGASQLTIENISGNGPCVAGGPPRTEVTHRSNALAEFLQERWDPQLGYLNLDDLPPTSRSITVVASRLLMEAQRLFGQELITLSFARNKIWSLVPVAKIAELFPGIRNLSFEDNDIAEFRSLDSLGHNKLPQLTELILRGNPLANNNNGQRYKSEIKRRFPSVTMLDQLPIDEMDTPTPFANSLTPSSYPNSPAPSPTPVGLNNPMLPPVKSAFFDQNASQQAAQDLLSRFFPLYDTNRAGLMDLYDPQSVFSLVASRMSMAQNTWGQGQRISLGNEAIMKRFASLPPTIHDLSRADNFMTDAWQTAGSQTHPVLLFLTVHGDFTEVSTSQRYSFDRVFLVAPSQSGSRAQMTGWQYTILSDSMTVRNYSGNTAFQPSA
ncbi:uncharacterized protein BYT42DRAFT_589604 [Radiomyces spectabilis]|uniref:uncharacterized protein n=1 Tax=Radiomyces spectabilis TaxID=64574 RepID=UPI00222022F1|nr:uncharacterized protein BYT42DRAFT_589604 [Radiomyces spectabilis]KAI8365343.1 hypothetical protein BYT42DRAFT_589604 [Radiomyces spectabilis]